MWNKACYWCLIYYYNFEKRVNDDFHTIYSRSVLANENICKHAFLKTMIIEVKIQGHNPIIFIKKLLVVR